MGDESFFSFNDITAQTSEPAVVMLHCHSHMSKSRSQNKNCNRMKLDSTELEKIKKYSFKLCNQNF